MAFTHIGSVTNPGDSTTASTTVHSIALTAGSLVVAYLNYDDSTGSITPDDAGWTIVGPEKPSGESAQHALYWRIAGSEPTSYTWTLGTSAPWRVSMQVWTSATTPEVDSAGIIDYTQNDETDLHVFAANGRTVAANSLSIACGSKDTSTASNEAYTTADHSHTTVTGGTINRMSAMASRIYSGSGETFAAAIIITTADASDGKADWQYSIHISFVEGAGGGGASTTINLTLLGTG